jgi:hypothetical protein
MQKSQKAPDQKRQFLLFSLVQNEMYTLFAFSEKPDRQLTVRSSRILRGKVLIIIPQPDNRLNMGRENISWPGAGEEEVFFKLLFKRIKVLFFPKSGKAEHSNRLFEVSII